MEFKFTKGKWFIDDKSKMVRCGSEAIAYVWPMNTDNIDERLEGESWLDMRNRTEEERERLTKTIPLANALLISKAPDMLEMLKRLYSRLGTSFSQEKEEIEQLIKEATEI